MNKNSLENFRWEAKVMKVPEEMIKEVERQMELEISPIELFRQIPADKGVMDLTLFLNKSNNSDFYYFNKFELGYSKGEPLAEGIQYFMIKPAAQGLDSPDFKRFESEVKAMDFFKNFKGTAELAVGKPEDMEFRQTVATMENGKVDYVNREFEMAYKMPVLKSMIYVNKGKNYNIVQAANMLQGRAAFRNDLVNMKGEVYKAWSTYLVNEARSESGHLKIKQNGYDFDLKEKLAEYEIKELKDEKLTEKLIAELQDGSRIRVHLTDASAEKRMLLVEAAPRFKSLNFFEMDGKTVMREQLKVQEDLGKDNLKDPKQQKDKGKDNSAGLEM